MTKISDLGITQDGTYLMSEDGKAYPVEMNTGYVVGVRSLDTEDEAPSGLFGRWTNHDEVVMGVDGYELADVVYWDEVELIDTEERASLVATMRGELAIWDNAAGEEIRV